MTGSRAAGVGLRNVHFEWIVRHRPPVAWFEILSENFMMPGGLPLRYLERIRRDYPLAMHGVSMSLGSTDPLNEDYLDALDDLVRRVEPLRVSDHLCWSGVGGRYSHDLWPLPYTAEALRHVVERIGRVQDRLGRRILVENVSTYLNFAHSEMEEWEFLAAVAEGADCGILLDINNIYVNAHNHGFAAETYLDAVPGDRVAEIHLAGPSPRGPYLVDTHDRPVAERAWELYEYFLRRWGWRPTLLEWDENIPEFPELLAEARKAEARAAACLKGEHETRPQNRPRGLLVADAGAPRGC